MRSRERKKSNLTYLQNHFNSKNTSESVIKVVENFIPEATLLNGIFRRKGDAAQTDNYHDEEIKIRQVHYPMSSSANP